MSGFILKKCFH